jgi:anti-sigma factor RsiW
MREFDLGELQDRLPDYVLGTLSAGDRTTLERALASDAELARDLDIVRAANAAFSAPAVSIDADRVVAALPRPTRRRAFSASRIRIAAAVATIAVGGASLAVLQQSVRSEPSDPLVVRGESTSAASGPELTVSFGYDFSALDQDDLDALFADLEQSAGLPPAEPRRTIAGEVTDEGVQ